MRKLLHRPMLLFGVCVVPALLGAPGAEPPQAGALIPAGQPAGQLKVLVLEGSPHERGVTHGRTLKQQIHRFIRIWKAELAREYKMDSDIFIKRFAQNTNYVSAMKRWTPDLLEEIHGIAEGAGLDFDTTLVLQLIDEYWVNGEAVAREHCSSLGFSKRGKQPACVAQNLDVESFRDGFQIILHIKHPDSGLESFVLSHAGLIGANGMNNRALGICCNTLAQLSNCRDGLPVACVIRGVLQQETEEAALAFLHRIKHASGQNYIIGGPANVYDLECSATKVSRFKVKEHDDVVWHTNHSLVNDDYNAKYRAALAKQPKSQGAGNSVTRLECLARRLTKQSTGSRIDLIKETLASKDSPTNPVCRSRGKGAGFTFASTIMELSAPPVLNIAPGPPAETPYETLTFSVEPRASKP
jgi:isopenicillin-N N-acyltransferase like protein